MQERIAKKEINFSERFNELLDMAGFPPVNGGRYTAGAKRFGLKSAVTFRSWCVEDKKPRSYGMLLAVVQSLLTDIPGDYDSHRVIAWLYGDEASKHPFKDDIDIDIALMLDVLLTVIDIANREQKALPKSQAKDITMKIYKHLVSKRRAGETIEPVEDNQNAINLINFCLEQLG